MSETPRVKGKWIEVAHACDFPYIRDQPYGSKWQCTCGQVWMNYNNMFFGDGWKKLRVPVAKGAESLPSPGVHVVDTPDVNADFNPPSAVLRPDPVNLPAEDDVREHQNKYPPGA